MSEQKTGLHAADQLKRGLIAVPALAFCVIACAFCFCLGLAEGGANRERALHADYILIRKPLYAVPVSSSQYLQLEREASELRQIKAHEASSPRAKRGADAPPLRAKENPSLP
jgi:hypothetical protein